MPNRKRNSDGQFASEGLTGPIRDNPWTSAAIAAGAAGLGALLWSRRGQIGDAVNSGMDRVSELKSQRMRGNRPQSQISEEAMTLKETGKTKSARSPAAQQGNPASVAASNQEAKAGAKAYS